jgi:hypothetical protein
LILILFLTLIAVGALLVLGQRPQPVPLPPSSLTLWMVIRNERPDELTYQFSDGSGGGVGGCAVSVSSNVMTTPWTVRMDGEVILSSDVGSVAFQGLAEGGDVVINIEATPDGPLEVSPLTQGTAGEVDQSPPNSCAGYVEPPPGLEIPAAFQAIWRTQVTAPVPAPGTLSPGVYEVFLLSGAVESQGSGLADHVQGAITELTETEITFGPSPICPAPGIYEWEMTDAQSILRLTAAEDICPERLALFAGDLERKLDQGLMGPYRYIARDFGEPLALTVPPKLITADGVPGHESSYGTGYAYYRVPGLGIEMVDQANTTPAACNGPDAWLTGGATDGPDAVAPEMLTSLDAFGAAFADWDLAHEAVTASSPQERTLGGRPAMMVEVVATAPACENTPGLVAGNILERTYAIDLGGRLLIIAVGPGVFAHEMFVDPDTHALQTYDPGLFDLADQLVQSLEFL